MWRQEWLACILWPIMDAISAQFSQVLGHHRAAHILRGVVQCSLASLVLRLVGIGEEFLLDFDLRLLSICWLDQFDVFFFAFVFISSLSGD